LKILMGLTYSTREDEETMAKASREKIVK
jgi:hypothetical protein